MSLFVIIKKMKKRHSDLDSGFLKVRYNLKISFGFAYAKLKVYQN